MKPFNELTETELKDLYFAFASYRDNICNGHAKMSVQKFYIENAKQTNNSPTNDTPHHKEQDEHCCKSAK